MKWSSQHSCAKVANNHFGRGYIKAVVFAEISTILKKVISVKSFLRRQDESMPPMLREFKGFALSSAFYWR